MPSLIDRHSLLNHYQQVSYLRSSMVELPQEIWETICSFLESSECKGLYGINSALFEIAMNKRYCEISFPSHHTHKEGQLCKRLMYVAR